MKITPKEKLDLIRTFGLALVEEENPEFVSVVMNSLSSGALNIMMRMKMADKIIICSDCLKEGGKNFYHRIWDPFFLEFCRQNYSRMEPINNRYLMLCSACKAQDLLIKIIWRFFLR
jgi:hypothetical protein